MVSLGAPVAAAQLSTMMLGLVDTLMVARVSVDAMAAAALANVWIFGTLMFANGVLFGLDPIATRAHGARDGGRSALALQTGVAIAFLLSLVVAALWTESERFLLLTGQEPDLARMAHEYTQMQLPGIPFFLVYAALRQYLQAREHMGPALWVILVANVVNVVANWALIFGHLGSPALGLEGAGLATSFTRAFACIGLILFVWVFRLHEGAWLPWTWEAVRLRRLREFVGYGFPIAVQMSLEMWAFAGAALIAGHLGAAALAAHTIAMNLASLSFMLPLGIAQGATTRVGNLLGAGRPQAAQRAAWVSMALGAGVMSFAALVFIVFRTGLPRLYTPDPAVVGLAAAILPIAAAFQVFDGIQVVACGVLRGMGRVRPAAVLNFVGYWLLALPIGGWLALRGGWGLPGLWWSLCGGLGFVALLLVGYVRVRGPSSLEERTVEVLGGGEAE
ncbi:MAG: MATE family efflux transporter [Myxococcota bacterium]|nr:MATE family efflux transporter [Myxococcota bacterium]